MFSIDNKFKSKSNNNNGIWVGIDFGTTNSTISIWDTKLHRSKTLRLSNISYPNKNNALKKDSKIIPSVVLLDDNNDNNNGNSKKKLIGYSALEYYEKYQQQQEEDDNNDDDENVILFTSFKRLISMFINDDDDDDDNSTTNVQSDNGLVSSSYTIEKINNDIILHTKNTKIKLSELLLSLLKEIKIKSEEYIQKQYSKNKLHPPGITEQHMQIKNCIICVPVQYTTKQCMFMKDVCYKSGFTGYVNTLYESTSAALSYGLTMNTYADNNNVSTTEQCDKNIIIFDMGGGTTDVTIVSIGNNDNEDDDDEEHMKCQVLSTAGNTTLGGDDINIILYHWVLKQTNPTTTTTNNTNTNISLLKKCRIAKETLCNDNNDNNTKPPQNVIIDYNKQKIILSQDIFNNLIKSFCNDAISIIKQAITNANSSSSNSISSSKDINEVVLVGGGSKVPILQSLMHSTLFTHLPSGGLCTSNNAYTTVGQGAAIYAAIQSKLVPMHTLKNALMLDILPYTIGVLVDKINDNDNNNKSQEKQNFVKVLEKGNKIPCKSYKTFQMLNNTQNGIIINVVEQISKNKYEIIDKFTFLLHRLTKEQLESVALKDNKTRHIIVGMSMDMHGKFIISIFDEYDPDHINKRKLFLASQQEKDDYVNDDIDTTIRTSWTIQEIILISFCIFLFIIYIICKIYFSSFDKDTDNYGIEL